MKVKSCRNKECNNERVFGKHYCGECLELKRIKGIRKCRNKECSIVPTTKSHYCFSCDEKRLDKTRKLEGVKGYDYLECPICENHYVEFSKYHAISHGYSSLKEFLDDNGFIKSKCQKKLDNMSGANNPAYQHGGKYSPWSKKFVHYGRYDIDELVKKSNKTRIENCNVNTRLDYYTSRGYSEEEAIELRSERQATFTLEKCIKRHGEVKGQEIFDDRQRRWNETLYNKSPEEIEKFHKSKGNGKEFLTEKYGYEKAMSIIQARVSDGRTYRSKAELEIEEFLKTNGLDIDIQIRLNRTDIKGFFLYDFKLGNKVIEYNGDYWHANPEVYKPNDKINYPHHGLVEAKFIWECEQPKLNLLKENGYELLIVWEKEFKQDKQKVFDKCLNFLME